MGIKSFQKKFGLDLVREAKRLWRNFKEGTPFLEWANETT
jgi:hypothetical protein